MSLFDDLSNIQSSRRPLQCPVGLLLQSLPDKDARALVEALDRPKGEVSAVDLAKILLAHGHDTVNEKKIQTHRRGSCACPRRPE